MNRSRIAATLMIPMLLLVPTRAVLAVAGPIPDPKLEAAVRSALHLDEKAELNDEKLKSLFVLDAVGKDIADLTGLAKCPNLALLRLAKGRVADLSALKDLQNLQSLDLSGNEIVDLGPLAGLTRLQYLNLAENRVEKLEPLAGLKDLNALDLSGNRVIDLRPIAGLSRLASLYLGRNKVADLGPMAGLTRISTLNLSDNQVEDIAPLAKLPDLDMAVVERNKVSDLGPIVQAAKSAPAGSSRWAFLRLYLAGNPLSDAAKGEQVTALRAAGVRIEL
jgi:internalin A